MTYEFAAAGSVQLRVRKLGFIVTFVLALLLAVAHASAQTPLEVDRVGIQQHRDYLRLQPFEQVDTGSSNLILTLPQLTLPGNAGSNLIFQLTYNSNTDVSPNPYPDWPWRFGIAGVPMQVLREGYYPTGGFMNTLAGTEPYTPVLRMADGAIYRTVYTNPNPNAGQQATMYEVRTSQFWKYHQDLHTLEMPDGRVFTYEAYQPGAGPGTSNLRLIHIEDVFGNTVDLGWSQGELDVVQTLRDGSSRTVHFTLNQTTGLPLTMTFNDGVHNRVWEYMYEGGQAADMTGRLATIDPPELQSDWIFEYHDFEGYRRLWHLTTPHGGIIEYDYVIQHFILDGQPEYTRAFLHTRDVFDRDSTVSAGQWVIDCTMYAGGSFCDHTTIRTPSALLTYTYGDLNIPNPTTIIEGPVGLKHIKVQDPTGANTFEDEDLTYAELSVVASTYRTVEVSQRSIQRNSAVYTTDVTYGDFRLPTHIFESGDVSRTTERTYATATSTPYLAGLLTSESIVVGSEAVYREFSHDGQGFITSASEPGVAPNNLQMSFMRDDGGNTASVTRRGLTTSYTYSHGTVETISTPLTSTVRIINLDGTIASESKGGRTTTFGYDLLSRVTSVQPPGGTNPTITEYDGAGTWIRTTRGASVIKTTLDGFGRPTLIEKGVGAEIVKTRTEYDAEGRVVYEGYPFSGSADRGTRIEYDALSRVTRRINPSVDPNNPTFSTLTYSPGSVVITDENGHHATQTWDAFGDPDDARLLSVLDADNKLWAYEYHVLGELAKVTAVGGVTRTWVYNDQHLLSSETHPESGTTTYGYDSEGRLTHKTDANTTTTTYTYDADNRIQTITAGSRVTHDRL
jgi:YD repeat-containing protein